MFKEIYHFIIHLRLHYQVLILSGAYFLGGFIAGEMNTGQYWLQFLNVHILLFGGATAYNSYWDKDTGPIGGLRNPPVMTRWMHPVSLICMLIGFVWSLSVNLLYSSVYMVSILLFWLYSTPHARWKGDPVLSLIAIGGSTGVCSVLLGVLAAGGAITVPVMLSATGASLILLSLYPVSQIFQIEEDRNRKDRTFAVAYGVSGVKTFFTLAYFTGTIILSISLLWVSKLSAAILFVGAVASGMFLAVMIYRMRDDKTEYTNVMKTKFYASFIFVCFFLVGNFIRYDWMNY